MDSLFPSILRYPAYDRAIDNFERISNDLLLKKIYIDSYSHFN